MKTAKRVTFHEMLSATREQAAASAWSRARLASALRHCTRRSGHGGAARRLARIKTDAIRVVLSLLPDRVRVTTDDDNQIGLLSIRWDGRGWLHLPADTDLSESSSRQDHALTTEV